MRLGWLAEHRRAALAVVAVIAAGIALLAYATDLLRSLELSTVDARFSIRGKQRAPTDLAVVAIDDQTFSDLGLQWPFPRHLQGELIDRLRRAGARQIAYDVQFTEPTTPAEDNALIRAVRCAGHVVLATTEVKEGGETNVFGGEAVLRQVGARAASSVVQPDPGGVLRQFPFSFDGLESFPVAAVESATGKQVSPSSANGQDNWIDYRGPPGTIPSYSFSKVLRGEAPPSAFRNKIVVVGAAAPSLKDVFVTPTSGDHEMPGAEVEANAIWTVEHGFPLKSAPGAVGIAAIALLAFAGAALSLRLGPFMALCCAALVGLLYAVAVQLAFDSGWVAPLVYPLLGLALAAVGSLGVTTLITAFERQRVRDTFSRFVPEAVVDEVLERTDGGLRLGGVRRECTILFSDLRGFTTFSETLEPDHVIELLNHYLSEMSEAIMGHGGTLVSYMGDGIMAVFGAPIEQPDHADRALAAAREMLDVRLPRFNEWMRSQELGEGFDMGIGLNSGVVMAGQVGSERRLEYTAVGDTTNTASRLEGMTKGTPHALFLAESTKAQLRNGAAGLSFFDELPVRGREAPIRVWTLAEDPAAS